MFALRVTYLMGRVYSAEFDDGDLKSRHEWPPHPSRLYSALVAAWAEGGAEPELRAALEWLEIQEPPEIVCGNSIRRRLVHVFVPVNDKRSLPDARPRKVRTFPSGALSDQDVYFVWRSVPPADISEALDRIAQRTSSLGHSASMVSVELAKIIPADVKVANWMPDAKTGTRLRVPYKGRLQELTQLYTKFERDPIKVNRPTRGRTSVYARPGPSRLTPRCIFDRMIILRRVAGPRAGLGSTLSLTSALRGALLKLSPQPIPEFLSGHAPESTAQHPARSETPHLALVPLAFVGTAHGTGEILGLAALIPAGLTAQELDTCWRVLGEVHRLTTSWGAWEVELADAEERRRNLRTEVWTEKCATWATVTPLVFDRFPKDPYGVEAEQVVRTALSRVRLPSPEEIDLHYNSWHLGVPRAPAFPPSPSKDGKPQRYHSHVRVRFGEEVEGPIVAGAGRYYGYGLFRPLWEDEQ
jgi:CRISPR-associated protein Csb2